MAGIPGLDRATMERERLERLKAKNGMTGTKRERSISPPATTRPSKLPRVRSTIIDLTDMDDSSTLQSAPSTSTTLQYPRGIVKKTWALGHARSPRDIKIEEVVEKQTLRTALLSSFQWDVPWILSKFNLQQTKFILVMQAKDEVTKRQYIQDTEDMRKMLRLCFPSMEGNVNCMHSKLMLLFHPHKLRIVVPTANLVQFDWGETGIMENSVFLIDLPRLENNENLTAFGQELLHFLEKMGCDEDIRKGLLNFDFGATKGMAFVHSVGGASHLTDMERTGFAGLSKAVRNLGLSSKELYIDFTASSIGSLNDEFLKTVHSAARGEIATILPEKPSRTAPKPFQNTTPPKNLRDIFRIYFPTHDTVKESTGGINNGGTVCFQRKWWEGNNTFPRSCFRDYRSTRQGLLSHNKILYSRGFTPDKKAVAWAYIGSANMSESAWGKLTWDRSSKAWKMGCRNWEAGVLIPVPAEKLQEKVKQTLAPEDVETESEEEDETKEKSLQQQVIDMDVFAGLVDLPFEYPGREFGDRQPWYFLEA